MIDVRKQLNIHPLIDIRLWEKTEEDRNLSFAKKLVEFAENQKKNPDNDFDAARDKMIVVFDGDIFEEKVQGYDELAADIWEDYREYHKRKTRYLILRKKQRKRLQKYRNFSCAIWYGNPMIPAARHNPILSI